jgi:outer membrane protein assembly factor BamD
MPKRLLLLLVLAAVLGSAGCSSLKKMWHSEDKNEGQPVEVLYDRGHEFMEKERWSSAIEVWTRLIAQYPYGPYTEQAQMEMAYAEFKAGKHDDAVSTIDRFIRTYPTQRNIPYFYYLRGLSNATRNTVFLAKVFSLQMSNRDLSTPMQAYNDFSIVVERYPNSKYAADAGKRMIALRNLFAKHELDTALYYLRRGADVAAATRAKYLLETYPQSEWQNDAVAVLGVAYTHLGKQTLADDARRVLQANDPTHPWITDPTGWPDYYSNLRKLNPFAGEKSPADRDRD